MDVGNKVLCNGAICLLSVFSNKLEIIILCFFIIIITVSSDANKRVTYDMFRGYMILVLSL